MNSGNWIELAALLVTILGGGGIGVSRMTRVAIAIETIGQGLEKLGTAMGDVNTTVQGHDTQLAVHETRITTLEGQQQPKP